MDEYFKVVGYITPETLTLTLTCSSATSSPLYLPPSAATPLFLWPTKTPTNHCFWRRKAPWVSDVRVRKPEWCGRYTATVKKTKPLPNAATAIPSDVGCSCVVYEDRADALLYSFCRDHSLHPFSSISALHHSQDLPSAAAVIVTLSYHFNLFHLPSRWFGTVVLCHVWIYVVIEIEMPFTSAAGQRLRKITTMAVNHEGYRLLPSFVATSHHGRCLCACFSMCLGVCGCIFHC